MAFPLYSKQMLEWLILPALVLIVVLVTAKPKSKDRDKGDKGPPA
ncbi:MAG: hypothetical protein U9Q81_24365 [Pseudomonadota bacterium]|nr:hypothetical protein [Pseudomonadota bacterium]